MYKDYRYINAGTNEVYRWGHKAQERALSFTKPGTDKVDKLVKGIEDMIEYMKSLMHRNTEDDEDEEEE